MSLLVDVAELDFPCFLDERGRMAESCRAWVDLPREVVVPLRVAVVVPPRPRVFVLGIGSFFRIPYRFSFRTLLLMLGTRVDRCACANSS